MPAIISFFLIAQTAITVGVGDIALPTDAKPVSRLYWWLEDVTFETDDWQWVPPDTGYDEVLPEFALAPKPCSATVTCRILAFQLDDTTWCILRWPVDIQEW